MKEFEEQGGVSFIILSFTQKNEIYYLPYAEVRRFWERMENGGRKSFTYEEVDKSWRIRSHREQFVHYLDQLQMDLERRD